MNTLEIISAIGYFYIIGSVTTLIFCGAFGPGVFAYLKWPTKNRPKVHPVLGDTDEHDDISPRNRMWLKNSFSLPFYRCLQFVFTNTTHHISYRAPMP